MSADLSHASNKYSPIASEVGVFAVPDYRKRIEYLLLSEHEYNYHYINIIAVNVRFQNEI